MQDTAKTFKRIENSSPGRAKTGSHLFIWPNILYNDHDSDVPGPHHTQSAAKEENNTLHGAKDVWTPSVSRRRVPVPGIFLKANLFGNGEGKNNQHRGDNNGKFAVSVPVSADCAV